jgi:hypothetical protein
MFSASREAALPSTPVQAVLTTRPHLPTGAGATPSNSARHASVSSDVCHERPGANPGLFCEFQPEQLSFVPLPHTTSTGSPYRLDDAAALWVVYSTDGLEVGCGRVICRQPLTPGPWGK